MSTLTHVSIDPKNVHEVLSKHILVDGYHVVMDLKKSRGMHLYDAKRDRMMLDLFSNFSTYPVGYAHPKVDNAEFRERIAEVAIGKPANSDIYTTYMAEFIDTFARLAVPAPLSKHMFFVEGGALGIENALKAAFDWKVRKNFAKGIEEERGKQVLHFKECFHGRTGYTLSMTNTADPRKTLYFPKFDWPRISNPKLAFPTTTEVVARVEAAEEQAVAEIQRALAERKDDIAALIIEPIQGEGGDNHFRPEFFRKLRQLANENEFLFICDEVQTGLGTTGKWWGFEHMDVMPDMFCFGKKTQVCGFAASDRILEAKDNVFAVSSRINSTWGGGLTDMVRAQRYLEIMTEERLVESAARVGRYFLDRLQTLELEFPGKMMNSRGRGLFLAFDLASGESRDKTLKACLENDLIGLASGYIAIRFRPALVMTEADVDEAIVKLRKALQAAL